MNIPKLRGKLIEQGMNVAIAAEHLGISKSALYRKLRNPNYITIGEANELKKLLNLNTSDAIDIFLS